VVDEIAVAGDGRVSPLVAWNSMPGLRVCRPYRATSGEWRCPVAMSGLEERLPDMAGEDSLQALCMALSTVRVLLEHFVEQGGRNLLSREPLTIRHLRRPLAVWRNHESSGIDYRRPAPHRMPAFKSGRPPCGTVFRSKKESGTRVANGFWFSLC